MLRAIVLGICVIFSMRAEAIEYAAGVRYEAGQRVEISGLGLSFQIPQAWLGGLADGAFIVASETESGMMFLVPMRAQSMQEVQAGLSEPLVVDETTTFVPSGQPLVQGDRIRMSYRAIVNGLFQMLYW